MHKKYKGRLFILTMALTLVLAGCSSVNRESDEAIKGSCIGETHWKKTEEVASQATDIPSPGILQEMDNDIENYNVDDDDQINISVAKYVKLTTEDLVVIEYPYLDSEDEISYKINEQIHHMILDGVLEDDGWTDRADVTYEITYVDDKLLSIYFTGYKMKGMYTNGGVYEIGMVFNLSTGDLLCLADVYSLAEIRSIFDTAISEGRIEGWIHYEVLPFSQDELEEYINNTFFEMIERENYINEPGNFFIKESKLCFLSEPYPSFHTRACLEIEIGEFPLIIEDSMECDNSQKDSADPQPFFEKSSYEGFGQLPEEITKQIEIYVNQRERFRSCLMEYRDVTHSELVDATYWGSGWETISREEWEHLEEDFLKDKDFITADFAWAWLWTYTYEELVENALADKELGEALEALYISWQELKSENAQGNESDENNDTESDAQEAEAYSILTKWYERYPDNLQVLIEWPKIIGTGNQAAYDNINYILERDVFKFVKSYIFDLSEEVENIFQAIADMKEQEIYITYEVEYQDADIVSICIRGIFGYCNEGRVFLEEYDDFYRLFDLNTGRLLELADFIDIDRRIIDYVADDYQPPQYENSAAYLQSYSFMDAFEVYEYEKYEWHEQMNIEEAISALKNGDICWYITEDKTLVLYWDQSSFYGGCVFIPYSYIEEFAYY